MVGRASAGAQLHGMGGRDRVGSRAIGIRRGEQGDDKGKGKGKEGGGKKGDGGKKGKGKGGFQGK